MARASLANTRARLRRAKRLREDPDEDEAAEAEAALAAARTVTNQSSELGDERPIVGCAFRPDGAQLATAAWSGLLKLWNMPHCERALTIKAHTDRVTGGLLPPRSSLRLRACAPPQQHVRGLWAIYLQHACMRLPVRMFTICYLLWMLPHLLLAPVLILAVAHTTCTDARPAAMAAGLAWHPGAGLGLDSSAANLVTAGADMTARLWSLAGQVGCCAPLGDDILHGSQVASPVQALPTGLLFLLTSASGQAQRLAECSLLVICRWP